MQMKEVVRNEAIDKRADATSKTALTQLRQDDESVNGEERRRRRASIDSIERMAGHARWAGEADMTSRGLAQGTNRAP